MSTKVIKRTPDLGLKIRLQPLAVEAPEEPCECDAGCEVTHVAWADVPTLVINEWEDVYTEHGDIVVDRDIEPITMTAARINVPRIGFGQVDALLLGVPFGPAIEGVTWSWSWSFPPLALETVEQSGPLLIVRVPATETPPESPYNATLIAIARCGEAEVGRLQLRVAVVEF